MESENLTNQRRQLVITLLGSERFEVGEERFPKPDHDRMRGFLWLEFLCRHGGRSDGPTFGRWRSTSALAASDVRPIHFRAERLGSHEALALALDVHRELRAAILPAVSHIVQMALGCSAPGSERLPLGTRQTQPKIFEQHGGADYHHRVIRKSIPFAEFTERWQRRETKPMNSGEIQKLRRQALEAYLTENSLTLNAFATKIDYSQSRLHAAVRGKKDGKWGSFGEKLAFEIEERVAAQKDLQPIKLFAPDGVQFDRREERLSKIEQQLLEVFQRLSPERQSEVVRDLAVEAVRQAAARGPPSSPETDPAAGRRYG